MSRCKCVERRRGRGNPAPPFAESATLAVPPATEFNDTHSSLEFRIFFAYKNYMADALSRLKIVRQTDDASAAAAAVERANGARRAAAFLVDRCLRELSRSEARTRRALGELIDGLRRRRGHVDLCFSRFGDWARERLGISGGEADALAKVARGLRNLPLTAAAYDRGEIGFTKARILVAVATEETEALWVGLARRRTVRELEEEVLLGAAASVAVRAPSAAAVEIEQFRDTRGEEIDGEEIARVRLSCPPRVWLEFRRTVALARCVAGEELSTWRAVEAIVAEGLGSAPRPVALEEDRGPPRPLALVRRRRSERARGGDGASAMAPTDVDTALRWLGLERSELEEILFPRAETALLEGATDLSPAEIDLRARAIERVRHGIDSTTGRLLRLLLDRGLHRELGLDSFADYVRERMGFSLRKARALVALERGVGRERALARAYADGDVSWVQTIVLLPLVRRGAPSRAWIVRAGEVTLRTLVAEADAAIERALVEGGSPPAPAVDGGVQMRESVSESQRSPERAVIEFRAPVSVVALWTAAIEAWRCDGEAAWQALARMLGQVTREWSSVERHRDPVFAREGWRCGVPGCSARCTLEDHHIVFRSRGGTNEQSNRVAICKTHHAHGIHEGRMRATGRAPDGILWELGLHEDDALCRLAGDMYLEGAPWGASSFVEL